MPVLREHLECCYGLQIHSPALYQKKGREHNDHQVYQYKGLIEGEVSLKYLNQHVQHETRGTKCLYNICKLYTVRPAQAAHIACEAHRTNMLLLYGTHILHA